MLRRSTSARSRIVGWMLMLLSAALAVPTFGITIVWQAELDRQVDAQLLSEADKLRAFARTSRDPYTGERFTTGASLLTAFMAVHRPEHNAAFFSVVNGRADRRSPGTVPARLDRDPEVVALMARTADTRIRTLDSPAGKVRYGVVPVQMAGDHTDTRLVLVTFRDRELRQERHMARLLLASGSFALVVAGLASWLVAGRVLAPIRLVRQTAERISETDLTQRLPVRGNDDVAELAETFNHMLDRLSGAFTAQRQFLDEVAHELRTPITVLRGHLELMDEDPDSQRGQTRALLFDELDRMRRIVEDLLLLARAERPDFLTLGQTSLTDLVVDTAAKAQALGRRHWTVAEVADVSVELDEQRVTQALMQLAANAVSHTEEGDIIEIGSRLWRGRVLLWVADTGPGVAPEDRERIFQCFYQGAPRCPAGPPPASGSASRWSARSPRHTTESPASRRHPGAAHDSSSTFPHCTPRRKEPMVSRILIAEDEARIAAFVEKGLRRSGYVTRVVADGVSAYEHARGRDFDLLILDLGLPGDDGLTVLRKLRKARIALPVVILTARDSVSDIVAGLESGADDYMVKPFAFDELLARVRLRLRREEPPENFLLRVGDLILDLRTRRAQVGERVSDLSAREFALAEILMRNPDRVLSREQLLSQVWGFDYDPGSNIVDVYIRYLRRKIGADRVQTVRGVGYRLRA